MAVIKNISIKVSQLMLYKTCIIIDNSRVCETDIFAFGKAD